MPVQQLIYHALAQVSLDRHKDVSVQHGADMRFTKGVHSIPVLTYEFADVAAEYPIVFTGEGDTVFPCAILGTREGENLFLGPDGTWLGKYVPAFFQRYPFVFAPTERADKFSLLIDEDFSGTNREGRGERLFDATGVQTQYLKDKVKFLQQYQARFSRTQAFSKALVENDLLQPIHADFDLGAAAGKRRLAGFQVIDKDKLKSLPDQKIIAMCHNDELECAYAHIVSARHFRSLADRLRFQPKN